MSKNSETLPEKSKETKVALAEEFIGDEAPPPMLGTWTNIYILEVVVLVTLIGVFIGVGQYYQ